MDYAGSWENLVLGNTRELNATQAMTKTVTRNVVYLQRNHTIFIKTLLHSASQQPERTSPHKRFVNEVYFQFGLQETCDNM